MNFKETSNLINYNTISFKKKHVNKYIYNNFILYKIINWFQLIFKLFNRFYKNIFNICTLIFLLIGRYLYIKSLRGCNGNEFSCLNIGIKYIIDDIYYCIESCIYFLLVLFLIQLKLCSFYNFLIFIFIIIELIYKDHGDTFNNHGILNLEALFLFLILGEIIILIILIFIFIIKKRKYILNIFIIFCIIIFFISFYFKYKDLYYCKNWDKSLNNTLINNDKTLYACSINIPKRKCLISIFSPFLDFSELFKIKCNKRKTKEKYLLKQLSNLKNISKLNRIGFPITINDEEIKGKPALYSRELYNFVKNNLIDMDNENKLNKLKENQIPEVLVDYSNDPFGELKITINFKKQLSLERQNIYLKRKKHTNDILFIYLDNLSRVHFYRQYKKTSKFIQQFLSYEGFSNQNNPSQKYHGFEFLKYHKFNGATLRNAIPMFSGVYYGKNNTMISIVRDLKDIGYITCNVQDVCHKELMHMDKLEKYTYIEFDHEYVSPNCDPNIYSPGVGLFGGENGILRKCLYGRESFEYSLEYALKFWKAYEYNKKFLRVVNTYGHEYTGEKSKYADDSLYTFLDNLYSTNQLKNTTVFLTGDHGFILLGIYKILNFEDWKIEYFFPIFILLVPDINNIDYYQQYSEIIKNQQNFITPFDIYYTIRHIAYNEDYKKPPLFGNKNDGESLFKYINPKNRKCSKYKSISKQNCQCVNNN